MKIQILEPCNENWNEMNPQEKGRFCGSCQKVVIDFTIMSNSEIVNHFESYKGNTCGRFYETQLNTNLVSLKPQKSTFWSKLAAASFTLFFFSHQSYSQNTYIQSKIIESNQSDENKENESSKENTDDDYFQIKGTVIDASQNSISDALVSIHGTHHSKMTDKDGNFEFNIAKTEIQNQDSTVLGVQKFGYTALSLSFDTEKTQNSYLELILKEAIILEKEGIIQKRTTGLTSVILVEECDSKPQLINGGAFGEKVEVKIIEKKSFWNRFKRLFTKS